MHAIHLLERLPWPLDNGRAINAHHLMRGLVERGHRVTALLLEQPTAEQLAAWPLSEDVAVETIEPDHATRASNPLTDSASARRWRRYWGVDRGVATAVATACECLRGDYVEGCGPAAPLWMTDLPSRTPRIWFAGDDLGALHWSRAASAESLPVRLTHRLTAAKLWMYERAVAGWIDAAVAVSPIDAEALRTRARVRDVLVTPNGIDTDYFCPAPDRPTRDTAAFCGRLDFPPNVEAVVWFLAHVWPQVVLRRPSARFLVIGRSPDAAVREAMAASVNVELRADVADVRPWVRGAAIAVLPMRSGTGIKNKLLEAAAMGKAIVASPRAVAGLHANGPMPWRTCDSAAEWMTALCELFADDAAVDRMGAAARSWVERDHRWSSHAEARETWYARTGGPLAAKGPMLTPAIAGAAA